MGAGMGGLATAARLADFGHDVTVLEQAETVGGQVGTYARDGHTFDTGPTTLTLPAVYRDLFRKTGRPLERVVDLVPVEPGLRVRFADGVEADLPNTSRAGTHEVLDTALGSPAGAEWQGVVDHGGRVWQALRSPYLEASPTRRQLARLVSSPGRLRTVAPWQSLRDLGRVRLSDHRLRLLLEHAAGPADPRRVAGALAAVPYVQQTFGRWYVRGGMRRLVEAVRDRAAERGTVIRTGAEATEVLVESGRAAGVRLADGEAVPADVVVAGMNADLLYGTLLAGGRRPARRPQRRSPSVFTVMLVLRDPAPRLPHHTVLFPEDTGDELNAVFGPDPSPPENPTVTVTAPDDETLRPDDTTRPWTVRVTVPPHGPYGTVGTVDWTAGGLAHRYADRVLAVLAGRGLDVRDRIAWRAVRTPFHLERATAAPGGAVWGDAIDGAAAVLRRPANRTRVRGLFLVGGSTYPGPGLPLVGLSAVMVTDLIGRA